MWPQAQAGVAASRMTTDTPRNLTAPHSPTLAGAPTTARWVAAGARHGGHRRGLGGRRGYRVACAWHTLRAHAAPVSDPLRSCSLPPPLELTVSAGVAALARPPPVAVPLGADTPASPPACSRRTRRTASVSAAADRWRLCDQRGGCSRSGSRLLSPSPPRHPLSPPRHLPVPASCTRHLTPSFPRPPPPSRSPAAPAWRFSPPALSGGRVACHARRTGAAAAWKLAPVTVGGGVSLSPLPFHCFRSGVARRRRCFSPTLAGWLLPPRVQVSGGSCATHEPAVVTGPASFNRRPRGARLPRTARPGS